MRALLVIAVLCSVLVVAAQEPSPLPAADANPYAARIVQLEAQLLARDNDLLHVRAEWATCRASLDSLDLTAQARALVQRCEAATGGKCKWDDTTRRVIAIDPSKEPDR